MKYPRTYHLPNSPGVSSSDKTHTDYHMKSFLDQPLIFTEKLDGENQFWSKEEFHLRSELSTGGELRSRAKAKWAEIKHRIPEYMALYVEDLSNKHSIYYPNKESDFYVIRGVHHYPGRSDPVHYMTWDMTVDLAGLLGLPTVPFIQEGNYHTYDGLKKGIRQAVDAPSTVGFEKEGIIVSIDFPHAKWINDWTTHSAKWVRANHVTTDTHWTQNALRKLNESRVHN